MEVIWRKVQIFLRMEDMVFTIHDNNGVKLDEFNYSNGILDGSFTQWYENGQMMAKYHYKKGY